MGIVDVADDIWWAPNLKALEFLESIPRNIATDIEDKCFEIINEGIYLRKSDKEIEEVVEFLFNFYICYFSQQNTPPR